MTFKSVVVTIAIVILILSLIVLGIIIYNSRNNDQFPPEIGNCPDYFVMKQKSVSNLSTLDLYLPFWVWKHENKKRLKTFDRCRATDEIVYLEC